MLLYLRAWSPLRWQCEVETVMSGGSCACYFVGVPGLETVPTLDRLHLVFLALIVYFLLFLPRRGFSYKYKTVLTDYPSLSAERTLADPVDEAAAVETWSTSDTRYQNRALHVVTDLMRQLMSA